MLVQEIIQLSRISDTNFHSLVQQALNHALWDYTLYFNEGDPLKQKLLSFLNESLAKLLFRFFCIQNDLPIEFKIKNDDRQLSFILEEQNWELINLSIDGPPLKTPLEISTFPAMIPAQKFDCSQKDDFGNTLIQWSATTEKKVLFTYLLNNSDKEYFLNLELPKGIEQIYLDVFKRKKHGKNVRESFFWKKLKTLGVPHFKIDHLPLFYIAAWAGSEHWKFFYNSKANLFPNIQSLSTNNKSIQIHRLPAFSRLFPQLNDGLHFADFLN